MNTNKRKDGDSCTVERNFVHRHIGHCFPSESSFQFLFFNQVFPLSSIFSRFVFFFFPACLFPSSLANGDNGASSCRWTILTIFGSVLASNPTGSAYVHVEICDLANRKNGLGRLALSNGGFTIDPCNNCSSVISIRFICRCLPTCRWSAQVSSDQLRICRCQYLL